tara:strand:- start:294 stop:959 length:666 start_codon:yes stop_codon:yes gene_type:complete
MSEYFSKVPDFEYVSRLPDAKISDYITVKNLFKRGKLADDILQDLTLFTKFKVQGDDRPDNVAADFYEDSDLDWLVLLSNNIINVQSEWPMSQRDFDRYLIDKYGTYEKLNDTHHHETIEIKSLNGNIIVPKGLQVESDFSVTYFDFYLGQSVTKSNTAVEVTNYQYEEKIEDDKRNIFLLKPKYINVVRDDLDEIMKYKKGSTQFISETLKEGENIKIYS